MHGVGPEEGGVDGRQATDRATGRLPDPFIGERVGDERLHVRGRGHVRRHGRGGEDLGVDSLPRRRAPGRRRHLGQAALGRAADGRRVPRVPEVLDRVHDAGHPVLPKPLHASDRERVLPGQRHELHERDRDRDEQDDQDGREGAARVPPSPPPLHANPRHATSRRDRTLTRRARRLLLLHARLGHCGSSCCGVRQPVAKRTKLPESRTIPGPGTPVASGVPGSPASGTAYSPGTPVSDPGGGSCEKSWSS